MPHILHIIKDSANRSAFDVLAAQARDPANRLSVVLMQTASGLAGPLPGDVFHLDGDGGRSPYPAIDHSRLLDLIFAADTVVTW
jgi:hypothetical protein